MTGDNRSFEANKKGTDKTSAVDNHLQDEVHSLNKNEQGWDKMQTSRNNASADNALPSLQIDMSQVHAAINPQGYVESAVKNGIIAKAGQRGAEAIEAARTSHAFNVSERKEQTDSERHQEVSVKKAA